MPSKAVFLFYSLCSSNKIYDYNRTLNETYICAVISPRLTGATTDRIIFIQPNPTSSPHEVTQFGYDSDASDGDGSNEKSINLNTTYTLPLTSSAPSRQAVLEQLQTQSISFHFCHGTYHSSVFSTETLKEYNNLLTSFTSPTIPAPVKAEPTPRKADTVVVLETPAPAKTSKATKPIKATPAASIPPVNAPSDPSKVTLTKASEADILLMNCIDKYIAKSFEYKLENGFTAQLRFADVCKKYTNKNTNALSSIKVMIYI